MADLSITASNVKLVSGPTGEGTSGLAFEAGTALYKDAADGKLKKATATTLAGARFVGIALNNADAADQPVRYAEPGAVVELGTGTTGLLYVVSGTAGGLSPHTDATTPASGEYSTVACIGIGSNRVKVVAAVSDATV